MPRVDAVGPAVDAVGPAVVAVVAGAAVVGGVDGLDEHAAVASTRTQTAPRPARLVEGRGSGMAGEATRPPNPLETVDDGAGEFSEHFTSVAPSISRAES